MPQFLIFLLVGAFNTTFGYIVIFAAMYLGGLSAVVSNVIGYSVGLVASYLLNRTFTFKGSSRSGSEPVKFVLVFLLAYFANLATLLLLIEHVELHEGLSQIAAGVVYVAASYLLNKHYVFRSSAGQPSASPPSQKI